MPEYAMTLDSSCRKYRRFLQRGTYYKHDFRCSYFCSPISCQFFQNIFDIHFTLDTDTTQHMPARDIIRAVALSAALKWLLGYRRFSIMVF